MKHVVIGTAGHVDHGKTWLTKALTGTNTDRLEEEQRRGITLDLSTSARGYLQLMFETNLTKLHNLSAGFSLNHDYLKEKLNVTSETQTVTKETTPANSKIWMIGS